MLINSSIFISFDSQIFEYSDQSIMVDRIILEQNLFLLYFLRYLLIADQKS